MCAYVCKGQSEGGSGERKGEGKKQKHKEKEPISWND